MLTAATDLAEPPNQVKDIAATIGAINMSISDDEVSQLIAHDKEWNDSEAAKVAKTKPFETEWKNEYPFWKQAAVKINAAKQTFEQWRQAELSKAAKETVKHIAKKAAKAFRNADLSNFHEMKAEVASHAATALYGDKNKKGAESEPDPSARTSICGTSGTTAGTQAGKSLKADLLCTCAKKSAGVDSVCCAKCDPGGANWNAAAASPSHWKPLLAKCPSHAPTMQLGTSSMNAALSQFLMLISKKQGSSNKKQYFLGTLDGTGDNGCDGDGTTNHGICVQYNAKEDGDTVHPEIDWMSPARQTAEAADKVAERNKRVEQLEMELRILNTTLGAQIHHKASDTGTSDRSTPTTQNQAANKSENNCNKHTNKTADECTKLGCDNDAENKKCKPKAGTESTAAATAGDGAAETTNSEAKKCSEKKTQGDKQSFAWRKGKDNEPDQEKEMCRNDSFLVNKKFALIAASFISLVKF
uniref:Variant surface glycoprotein 1125.4709 n=1 Tax=Trypanosoma brucei TaxID=5691 RepID=A0A1J0RAH4_9TRYP|nr:variant surface glycoprotein 1125.4709 [Trypanosoma brucei]